MNGNNITSDLVHNASYSSFTTVPSTEEDPRISAAYHVMYKIGTYVNKHVSHQWIFICPDTTAKL